VPSLSQARTHSHQHVRRRLDTAWELGKIRAEQAEAFDGIATRIACGEVRARAVLLRRVEGVIDAVVQLSLIEVAGHLFSLSRSSRRARWSCDFTVPPATPVMAAISS
jgi:hypothetical protein